MNKTDDSQGSLLGFNMHWEQVWLTVCNANQTPTLIIQDLNNHGQRASDPVLVQKPPQDESRDWVERLVQVQKAHVGYLCERQ